MAEAIGMATGSVERFGSGYNPNGISEELGRIMALLQDACPPDAIVSFGFDGRLQVHIDVRKREHVMFVEMALPSLEQGLFHGVSIGGTPGHPFYHRVSAQVRA